MHRRQNFLKKIGMCVCDWVLWTVSIRARCKEFERIKMVLARNGIVRECRVDSDSLPIRYAEEGKKGLNPEHEGRGQGKERANNPHLGSL